MYCNSPLSPEKCFICVLSLTGNLMCFVYYTF
uniref:Uncharacterized protein n=1 Tax=Anguilla anguilla TaxID=7936 RepID=A0A0E9U072_ANGAN